MAPSPMEWYSGNSVFQISVGTWSSTWMMIFISWQSRLFVMEIVTLQLNLTNYTYLYTLYHNFVTTFKFEKNKDVNVHNIKVHLFHFFSLLKISKNIIAPIKIHGGQ